MVENVKDSNEKEVISASLILGMIKNGQPVEYTNIIIDGNLDIKELRQPFERFVLIQSSISIQRSVIKGYVNFSRAIFKESCTLSLEYYGVPHAFGILSANFNEAQFLDYAFFSGAFFAGDVSFRGAQFHNFAHFSGIYSKYNITFEKAQFGYQTSFNMSKFDGGANFKEACFNGYSEFNDAYFSYGANFNKTNFGRGVDFSGTQFIGGADFDGALLGGYIKFWKAKFGEELTFHSARFREPQSQEYACRTAKKILNDMGIKEEADYHFYHEMEARRLIKGIRGNDYSVSGATRISGGLVDDLSISLKSENDKFVVIEALIIALRTINFKKLYRFLLYDVLEFIFIQKIFGYGVHPFWLFGWWWGIVIAFACIYSIRGGLEQPEAKQWYDYLWFSIATAATPGYALYKPLGSFKFIAGIEAILGTFMWAAFITTFARKFMK